LFVHSPATLPPKIGGMAWWRQFDEPPFPPIVFAAQKQQTSLYVPTSLPFVSGISWWGLFDVPIYFKPKQEVERWPQYPWTYLPPPIDPELTLVVPQVIRTIETPDPGRQLSVEDVIRSVDSPDAGRGLTAPAIPRILGAP
jgi:hypothetical protein